MEFSPEQHTTMLSIRSEMINVDPDNISLQLHTLAFYTYSYRNTKLDKPSTTNQLLIYNEKYLSIKTTFLI